LTCVKDGQRRSVDSRGECVTDRAEATVTDSDSPPGAEEDREARIGRISAASRLTDVIAAEPAAIERLLAIDPIFRDLEALSTCASPLGPTLRQAAERVGVPVAALLAVITGQAPAACFSAEGVEKEREARPDWLDHFHEEAATRIDVRPSLAAGRDPFTTVMAAAAQVPQGGELVIDAPFDPVPLRRVLERRGFATFGRRLAEQHWRICCHRDPGPEGPVHPPPSPSGATVWRSADVVHIDVRGLPPPAPLTAILRLIDSGEHEGIIIVHHQREPVYLIPELADRNWAYVYLEGEPGEVRLRLTRRAPADARSG
jgi:uncharacterized protein (DUF2249 family)